MGLFGSSKNRWELSVPNISCDHCERRVRNALEEISGIEEVRPDAKKKRVTVRVDSSQPPEKSAVYSALEEAGYPVADA
jgi:copper chaperone CopZ